MAANLSPQELQEFYNKGVLAFEKKNYEYAVEIFSQILVSAPEDLKARHYLHAALKNIAGTPKKSGIARSINSLRRSIMFVPVEGMLKKGQLKEALDALERLLAQNPFDTAVLKKMSEVFRKDNLLPNAVQALEEAKEIDEKDVEILKCLGELYLRLEDYKNARVNLEAAKKISPDDSEIIKSLKNLDALGTIQREFNQ
jgi:tetratricopeptide (TPR) repeat protein